MRKNPISKPEVMHVSDYIQQIKSGELILNHPLQRCSEQWSCEQKGNLIRRVLHEGQFLPILICTQYDEHNCEVRYLIDGVQRITTFDEYLKDKFAISKNIIDYIVSYDGVLYETKELKSGKFALKRDRNKNLIPILDEEGKKQRRVQEIDIRGLKYSELPPELQNKISKYLVNAQLKLECTDEDIQIEILDYNSGTKMNDAQIGKNRLGVEFARIVTDLSNHPFILNKCGFTHDNRIKGVIDRAINEALMLVNFGTDNWVTSHKDLCRRLSNWLTIEHTDKLNDMFDDLDDIIPENDEIKDALTLKEFFVVMANYKHFLDFDYKKECYGMFLNDFVQKISLEKNIATGEIDDDGNDIYDCFKNIYMTGTKQKGSIQERLEKMNEIMNNYLAENCADMIDDGEDEEELATFYNEFDSIGLSNSDSKNLAIKSLMGFTDYPTYDFTEANLKKFNSWIRRNGSKELYEDCLFFAEILKDKFVKSSSGGKFSENDIAIMISVVRETDENISDELYLKWLKAFINECGAETDGSSSGILEKKHYIINNINTFIKGDSYDEV